MPRPRITAFCALAACSTAAVAVVWPLLGVSAQAPPAPMSVLTVGGGPRPDENQVAIESNVRYVDSLLPGGTQKRVLFANGDPQSKIVRYTEVATDLTDADRAFRFLFGVPDGEDKLRAPQLRSLDGPSRKSAVRAEMDKLAASGTGPTLLYFTGHGERNRNLDNNIYDLWEGERPPATSRSEQAPAPPGGSPQRDTETILTVRELAAEIKKLPANRPVTIIMVQCFSGAFGNLLFEEGNPANTTLDRPICGFFAATRERVAAGCTPEINEANYKDFTSYFFAALSGKDRTGKSVQAEDYNHDGKIGMDEAFTYALINEPSVDVPVSTSDVYLRRFAAIPANEVANTPYSQVVKLASPAQKAALEGISKAVGASGEDRLKTALADIIARNSEEPTHNGSTASQRDARETAQSIRRQLIERFPKLRSTQPADAMAAGKEAVAYLAGRPETVRSVNEAAREWNSRSTVEYADEIRGSRWLRLMRVAGTVLMENKLRQSDQKDVIARFDRLRLLESQNPLK